MSINSIPLSDLVPGQCGTVKSVTLSGAKRRRILDLGIVPGTCIKALHQSPAGNPVAYLIRGSVIALRLEDAIHITLMPIT